MPKYIKGGAVMPEPHCKHYKPKEPGCKENGANCFRWVGIQCLNHLELVNEYQTTNKFAELDKVMRTNKGVWIG